MPSVTFDELMRAGRDMRQKQKEYYRLGKNDAEKQTALTDSKLAERYFDSLLGRKEDKQLDIFSVLNAEDEPQGRTCQRCGDPMPMHNDAIAFCSLCINSIGHEGNEEDPFPPLPQADKTPGDAAFDAAMRDREIK